MWLTAACPVRKSDAVFAGSARLMRTAHLLRSPMQSPRQASVRGVRPCAISDDLERELWFIRELADEHCAVRRTTIGWAVLRTG